MPTSERLLEERLSSALAFEPSPDGIARLDARMAQAIERHASERRRRQRWRRPMLRAAALLAALLILGAAAVGGATLLDLLVAKVEGWRVAVERSTPLDLSQTVNGVTVRVIGAYADANEIYVSIAGPETPTTALLRGPDGDMLEPTFMTTSDTTATEGTVALAAFRTPPDAGADIGPLTLEIPALSRIPGEEQIGPWQFTFSVANAGGLTVEPDVADVEQGVEIRLERMTISATSVQVSLTADGLQDEWSWTPVTRVEQNGRSYGVGGGDWEFGTVAGTDDPTGQWSVVVSELIGFRGDEQMRISGQWEFLVEVPSVSQEEPTARQTE